MSDDLPGARNATLHVLHEGYVRPRPEGGQHVGSTVTLVLDGDAVVVVDPGFVADRAALLAALRAHGPEAEDVTDIVLSHHHPDHTLNAALFPCARAHDHQAVYDGDLWVSRPVDRVDVSPSVRLLATPGHTAQDISAVIGTADGVVVTTHAWWRPDGPADDPYAPDREVLRRSRERLLAVAGLVVPGHAAPFVPDAATPL